MSSKYQNLDTMKKLFLFEYEQTGEIVLWNLSNYTLIFYENITIENWPFNFEMKCFNNSSLMIKVKKTGALCQQNIFLL